MAYLPRPSIFIYLINNTILKYFIVPVIFIFITIWLIWPKLTQGTSFLDITSIKNICYSNVLLGQGKKLSINVVILHKQSEWVRKANDGNLCSERYKFPYRKNIAHFLSDSLLMSRNGPFSGRPRSKFWVQHFCMTSNSKNFAFIQLFDPRLPWVSKLWYRSALGGLWSKSLSTAFLYRIDLH